MSTPPLLSMLIPVYRVEKYISRTLESIFSQHDPRLEYIFVDDATPDASWTQLEAMLERYPACRASSKLLRHEQNRGVEAARITALEHASGKYIWFVDSDDLLPQGATALVLTAIEQSVPDYLALSMIRLPPGKNPSPVAGKPHLAPATREKLLADLISFSGKQHGAWQNIIRREIIKAHPLQRTGLKIAEDYVMHVRWASFAETIVYLRQPVYGYVQREQSATSGSRFTEWAECLIRAVGILEKFFDGEAPEEVRDFGRRRLHAATVSIRAGLLRSICNDYPPAEYDELLDNFAGVFSDYTLRAGITAVSWAYIPIVICDKLKWRRAMAAYAHLGKTILRLLPALHRAIR